MRVVLLADAREELERRTAVLVLVEVLLPDLREHTRHGLGANAAVDRRDRAVPARRRPRVGVGLARPAREQARAGELLHPDREAVVGLTRLHRHDRGAEGGGAGGARVRHVVDGDAGLADLLLQLLAHAATAEQVAGGEDAHVLDGLSGVGERTRRGLRREVDAVLVGVLAELRHVDPENPDVVAHLFRSWL
jgi:hypothetical protein